MPTSRRRGMPIVKAGEQVGPVRRESTRRLGEKLPRGVVVHRESTRKWSRGTAVLPRALG